MGTFHVKFTIRNPVHPERSIQLEGLVDSGAHFSQVPGVLLEQIGITPFDMRQVQYADGTVVAKPVASAEIVIEQRMTPTVVLCGEPNDLILIGALALEGLNLGIDPIRKVLTPLIVPQA